MPFKPGYLKEGPGLDRNAPPKKGLALFFEILGREFWQILKLNLFFVLCSLPLVTFGPARAALSSCTVSMARDIPNDVNFNFRRQFRTDWKRHLLFGLAELLWSAGIFAALWTARDGSPVLPFVLAGATVGGLFFGYLWPLSVTAELPLRALLKNAMLLSLGCLHHSLPALLAEAALLAVFRLFMPLTLPLLLFVPFGMSSFVMSFAAWTDMKKLVISKTENGGKNDD